MVALIKVDVYPFLAFLDQQSIILTTSGYRNTRTSHCTFLIDTKNSKLRRKQEASPLAGTFICHVVNGSVSLEIFLVVYIFSV